MADWLNSTTLRRDGLRILQWLVLGVAIGRVAVAQGPPAAPARSTQTETVLVLAEPVPAETLAGTYTVLDGQDIVRTGSRDLAELMRFVSVGHLSQAGSKGSLTTVSLRAAKPNFTLVLVNGVPVNDIGDLLGGAFNFATISTADVDRIEILRGPLSSVYGSEAAGGVISITLRHPDQQPLRVSAEGGNCGAANAAAGSGIAVGRFAGSWHGGFARMGQQVLDDGFNRGSAVAQGSLDAGKGRHADSFIDWDRLSSTSFPVSSGGPRYALSPKIETDRADQLIGGVQYQQQVRPRWFYTAGYDAFSRVAFNFTPAILDSIPPGKAYVPESQSDTRFLRQRVLTVQRFEPSSWLKLDGVAQYRDERGISVGTLAAILPASYRLERPTEFFSGNATASFTRVSLTAGIGAEKSNVYHTVLSPRVGASYRFGETRVHGSWGQGFKFPSFYALGNPLVGNRALRPEFSSGFDAGIEHKFRERQISLALTGFNTRFRDLIDFSPQLFQLVNRQASFGRGVELEGDARVGRATVGGSVSYVDAGLEGTAERLRDVPRWSEDVKVQMPLGSKFAFGVSCAWVGRRFDYQVPVPGRNIVPAYSATNVNISYKLNEALVAHVRVENLFDRKYEEFVGFPSPGSYATFGLSYTAARHRGGSWHGISNQP